MVSRSPRRPASSDYDHRDWLALIDYSGPFLSVPVLKQHFSAGPDALDKAQREALRQAHEAMPGPYWIDYVLRDLLEWDDALVTDGLDGLAVAYPEHDTTLTPDFVLSDPGTEKPRLLGMICAGRPTQRVKGSDWSATPADRLLKLLRHHKVELGLCTDGRWWALLWCPPAGGATSLAVFDSVNWHEKAEREVVKAFLSILRRSRFFAVPDEETLPALLAASVDNQEVVTDQLGVNVRRAVELLVLAIDRANARQREMGRPGFLYGDDARVSADEVYNGAVAVMMRIVFLLFAEERGLLPADRELYRRSYSVGLLLAELEDRVLAGSENELEHTWGAWNRLLATFNAVYAGIDHPELTMHAHDGSIFDPKRFPWLPATIDDRTVLHMLRSVQQVTIGRGKTAELRRLSFNQLDVEQIGYVYEGLLAFEGRYADDVVLGLQGKEDGYEVDIALAELTALHRASADVEELAAKLAAHYKVAMPSGKGAKGMAAGTLARKLAPMSAQDQARARDRLLAVTRNDVHLVERILPYYGLIRLDLREQPCVYLADALYVTGSALRGSTGTHYTPKFLAEEVVEGALEPLMFDPGPLQTADTEQWVPVSSEKILSLKVADIAMGSAAFLVAACRYLADHLVQAWSREGDPRATDYLATPKENALADEADQVVVDARRQIIEHCLYGADINPMAVELAKLSLWLVSMDKSRPFTFLDDRLVSGDSLLGITSVDQLEWLHFDPAAGRRLYAENEALFDLTAGMRGLVEDLARERQALTGLDGSTLAGLEEKRRVLTRTARKAERLDAVADVLVGATLAAIGDGHSLDHGSGRALSAVAEFLDAGAVLDGRFTPTQDLERQSTARKQAEGWLRTDLPRGAFARRPLHWPLSFPEVFDSRAGSGFDAIIGNPPFLGGQKLTGSLGTAYREYLVHGVGGGVRGSADLIAYFAVRAHALLREGGQTGLIATNTLAQGDTRQVGLDRLCESGVTIRRAVKSAPWPSRSAVLEYCAVWTSKQRPGEAAAFVADGAVVSGITSSLDPESRATGQPQRLAGGSNMSFQGANILGLGFTMEPSRARELIAADPRNSEVLFPYLNGQDLNNRPDCSGSRWVINFHDWTEDRARTFHDCYDQVNRLVRPDRERVTFSKNARELWWLYERRRPELFRAIAGLDRIIVITLVSKTVMPVIVPTGQVFSHMLGVFATDDTAMLAFLSSAPHYWWAVSRASTLETRVRYTPSDVFETLPLPNLTPEMRTLGDQLDRRRREIMLSRDSGLTKTYNLVHAPSCADADIAELRTLHRDIDVAVCRAYGWDDLIADLDHGHHDLGREVRYTVAPAIQREFVDRLLELNHARYAEEVAAGLHDKKQPKKAVASRRKDTGSAQGGLF
ncbi:Eco57I restriction-modification methylase domain-containing protein [Nocardia takedensis]|uniref:Eco57I restriction-modification methylase domain-containing protein n=1 Tax=Nocardia takedensis TaxID=259390 RepID=UPI00059370B3|nr:type IIL restriction-modification enzyme MmeI [Nocardia takedensis]